MMQMTLVLSILGNYVVSLTATIPPDYALQDVDYLCNGSLKSNTTVVLDGGEHRISTICTISNISNVTIMGSSINSTTIRCEGGSRFQFVSVQQLTIERVTFISCGIILNDTENTLITTCIFQDSIATDYFGSAVTTIGPTGYFSIQNCTFRNNSASDGGAMRLYGSTGDVNITNCTFQNNNAISHGGGGGAMFFDGPAGNVGITDCTFQNNNATDRGASFGGAVWLSGSTGNVGITNCTFQNNSATSRDGGGGAVFVDGPTGGVSITDSTFQNNSAGFSGGAVLLDGYPDNVGITNCTFQNNNATNVDASYGGAVGLSAPTGNVGITNCTFQSNSATYGGAGSFVSTDNVIITNCTFQNNSATFDGGAAYVSVVDLVIIDKSTFINNSAVRGAAVYASNVDFDGYLTLQEVRVENNHCFCNGYPMVRGGAIYFNAMKVNIIGDTITGSQFLSNSPLGAITGENGFLQLYGNVSFYDNTGENGGAISLSNKVLLYFYDSSAVQFSRNVATGYGGAIYSDGGPSTRERAFSYCTVVFIADSFGKVSSSITFTDNHAEQGGHAVYATNIYGCSCIQNSQYSAKCENVDSYFTITPLQQDLNDIQVLSFPTYVQLCNCSDPDLCNVTGQYEGKVTTYPGGTVKLNVTSVDDGNNLSPGVVYALIGTNGDTTTTITLGPGQEAQWIGTVCGTIEYQIYGPEMASLNLVLSTSPGNFPIVIKGELLPCEPGFKFVSNSSTCDCSPFFVSYGVVCDTSDGTVTIKKKNWIGVYNNTLPALASFCPLDYCNSAINKLFLGRPGDLCSGGRTGTLCGHCHGNYSVIFGSSQCQVCTDMWLSTLVMFAVLGAFLVATLFFLNLTVTQGTLYGLIFYANIIQVNTSIFFSQSTLRPLQVIVSLVNLDLGIPLCFYDGMDDADKAGLQFVFPAYLLVLTMTVIVLCHYCFRRSPTTSTRSCVYRVFIIIGQRAVGVLSTLIYLSYSKVLRSVIDVFTYSTVHLPTGDIYVWFYDGNVEYLHGKHTVIFVVAMVICALFLLPYIFALTFIPIIEKYSEHNRLFNYLHKKANQIKPMIDAHYAPYKGEWRWWLGARLWLLVLMYILNSVFSSDKPSLLLSVQATAVILFTLSQAGIKPFGQSLQESQKFNRHGNIYNQFYNSLDLFYLLNYIVLALSMSYILDQDLDQTQLVGVLVGLYVVVVMVTVLYHLIVAILKACGIYDKAKERIDGLFQTQRDLVVPAAIEMDCINLREPLLYED